MVDSRFVRHDWPHSIAHFIEEAGEALAAAGKTVRWGLDSYNPDLPESDRESNAAWLWRELADLDWAMRNLHRALIDKCADLDIELPENDRK